MVAFCGFLLFFFVPETFWDRAPQPRKLKKSKSRPTIFRRFSSRPDVLHATPIPTARPSFERPEHGPTTPLTPGTRAKGQHVAFAPEEKVKFADTSSESSASGSAAEKAADNAPAASDQKAATEDPAPMEEYFPATVTIQPPSPTKLQVPETPKTPKTPKTPETPSLHPNTARSLHPDTDTESQSIHSYQTTGHLAYTAALRDQPARSFTQSLKPYNGRLNKDKWHKVALRPLILFSYPAVLWSSVVYACSVGWLIVISESVAVIYREGVYEFNALQTGLVYISPFIGGILGSAVAGRVSDVIVKAMARRNGGLYEPEYRLVMAIPIAITTVIGLMGFGWSAQIHNHWMVPTAFFGIISFGCTMGSTTSITFCVDSYRQYAGEALVTLNFSKNVLHGLVFSLFVTGWLSDDGPKAVYIWIGIIQLILLLFTIPMYIYGKRLRMWTVRKNFMERF